MKSTTKKVWYGLMRGELFPYQLETAWLSSGCLRYSPLGLLCVSYNLLGGNPWLTWEPLRTPTGVHVFSYGGSLVIPPGTVLETAGLTLETAWDIQEAIEETPAVTWEHAIDFISKISG